MKQKDGFKSIFGTEYTKETYQMKGHSFSKLVSSKPVCISCGLNAYYKHYQTPWTYEILCLIMFILCINFKYNKEG